MSAVHRLSTVSFSVPGQPVAWGRARVSKSGGFFTPEKTRRHENMVKSYAQRAMNGELPFGGPVQIFIEAYMEIPKSWSIRKKEYAHRGLILPITKPDLDNITKAVLDALNKTVFVDDSQIVNLLAQKRYSNVPQTTISVIAL